MTAVFGYHIGSVGATAGQIMKIVTSDGGGTFYLGRCFRTDIKAQTDNLNANSVDVILMYNSSYIQPYTSSGCTIAATAMQADGLFGSYPSNTIGGGLVQVTGYDPTGTNPVNTGAAPNDKLFGHIYWKVMAASGSYFLPFQFTLGSTTDTNMAQQGGNGTDILTSVQNLTIALATDSTIPAFTSLSPASNATGVSVTTGVSYVFSDAGAGVNTGTLVHSLNGATKAKTFSGCTRTNSNRIPSCTVTMSSVGTLAYNTLYRVSATGSDLASPSANTANQVWTFTTEDDTDAPYLSGQSPANGATGVAANTTIVFHIKDYKGNTGVTPGLGVDISTVSVTVTPASGSPITYTSASAQFSYTGTSADYTVTISPANSFPANTAITVSVNASDLHSPANVMGTQTYSFSTADTTAPAISGRNPDANASGVATTASVVLHVTDTGAGVSIGNTTVTVNGTAYTSASPRFSYTGTSADYTVTISPTADFANNSVVSVTVTTRDQASTPNTATSTYGFYVGTTTAATTTVTAAACSTASTPTGGGGSRKVSSILSEINPADLPVIIARKHLPDSSTVVTEQLSAEDARNVHVCYVDDLPVHGAAPRGNTLYTDVPAGAWYESAVKAFLGLGILDATQPRFRPNDSSARAELAKVLGKLHGRMPETLPKVMQFDDVPRAQWYAAFIEFAGLQGWMRGYQNCVGTHPCRVMPGATISRAEAVTMLVRFYGLKGTGSAPSFSDVDPASWYAKDIAAAADHCMLQGIGGTRRAAPAQLLTRAEMIVLLDRARRGMEYGLDCGDAHPTGPAATSISSAVSEAFSSARSSVTPLSSAPSSAASASQSSASASSVPSPTSASVSSSRVSSSSSVTSAHPAAPAQNGTAGATLILIAAIGIGFLSRFLAAAAL